MLTETVVRVPVASFGGSGSPLNAGYPAADEDPDPVETYFSIEDEEKEEEDGSGFAKELLISGWGRSQWGECSEYERRGRIKRAKEGERTDHLFHLLTMERILWQGPSVGWTHHASQGVLSEFLLYRATVASKGRAQLTLLSSSLCSTGQRPSQEQVDLPRLPALRFSLRRRLA